MSLAKLVLALSRGASVTEVLDLGAPQLTSSSFVPPGMCMKARTPVLTYVLRDAEVFMKWAKESGMYSEEELQAAEMAVVLVLAGEES